MIYNSYSLKFFSMLLIPCILMLSSGVSYSGSEDSNLTGQPFSHDSVMQLARELAQEPFQEPEKAPESLTQMDYSTYRKINFKQDQAVWGSSRTKFSVEFFAPGFLFKDLVDIDVVENGLTYPVKVTESSFKVPDEALGKTLEQVGKFSGFRIHYPVNRHDYKDEFIAFQGASYFRGVSKGQLYGLSMRGLAIDTAQPTGEEFPRFIRFWIERPSIHQEAIVVHALLDSKSVSGAYRFGIYPGSPTRVDVDVTLFPRREIKHYGLAPLTSMFMHGPMVLSKTPDYRPAVHDSEALAIITGNDEQLWRPLNNPQKLQVSAFIDEHLKGFGLIQRNRDFSYYQDLEAKYHLRPSAWVKPIGDWGKGHVELIEIPSDSEINDNIVAYWQPAEELKIDQPFSYSYRLIWPDDLPSTIYKTRIVRSSGGEKLFDGNKEIVVDYSHLNIEEINNIQVEASISRGSILESVIEPNPYTGGTRVFFSFDPENADVPELRLQIKKDGKPIAATWLYRWTNQN